jgi:glycine/D-amino acid oxidase-like deaminating enzyme
MWAERVPLLPLYDRLGKEYEVLTAAEIGRRWPALHPPDEFVGLHDPSGGYSEPDEYIAALVQRLRQLRVEIVEGQQVENILLSGERITGVQTSTARFEADAVVSGIHSWSLLLWKKLGLRLPIKSFVHQRYVSAPLAEPFVIPPVNADPYLGYVRPARGGRILLGVETAERRQWDVDCTGFAMDELSTSVGVRDEAVQRFSSFVPALRNAIWESQQVGLIAFSMDGEPILGPVHSMPGFFIAGAFHSGGFSYNTVAGLLLAEMAASKPPSVDVTAFSPDRFSADATEAYLETTLAQSQAVRRRH